MTDKQIIIDGVDVSGCNRLNTFPMQFGEPHEICLTSLEQWGGQEKYCKDRPNCYYKNWQRKEQECERLKKIINEAKNSKLDLNSFFAIEATVGEYQLELDQLKAENRILKEKFEIAIKNNMDKTLLRLENGDVKEELQEIREEFGIETLYCHDDNTRVHRCIKLLQLKDCLTEIKEIAEHFYNTGFVRTDCGATLINNNTCINSIQQILQKISECEGNDGN